VAVAGTEVAVGGSGVAAGGAEVATGGTGVFVGGGAVVGVGPQAVKIIARARNPVRPRRQRLCVRVAFIFLLQVLWLRPGH